MGYRSDVKSVIYGSKDDVTKFKEVYFNEYNQLAEDFATELTSFDRGDRTFIYLDADYIKWYDEYEETQRWQAFLILAQDLGLATEFVRVGESSDGDIEQEYGGEGCLYYLTPRLSIDVGFNYQGA
jgi:hypothetical protein